MPPTYTITTPRGGRHLYIRWPKDRIVGNRAKINGVPIDARGEGGYIVAPPSASGNGKLYVVERDVPLADAPAWLLDLVAPIDPPSDGTPIPSPPSSDQPANGAASLDARIRAYLAKCPPAISGQRGHDQTYAVACALVQGFALSAGEALPHLTEWNQQCEPPWAEKELRHKLGDAETKGSPPPGKHRGYLLDEPKSVMPMSPMGHRAPAVPTSLSKRIIPIKSWKPFPAEALPGVVRRLVEEGAAAIGIDPAFIAVVVLPVLAGCIGNARRIRLKDGWEEPAPIWGALVADSGSSKSPALDLVAAPLHEMQSELFAEHAERIEEHQRQSLEYDKHLAEWRKSKGTSGPPREPTAPTGERIVVADTTIEKLGHILRENPRGIIIVRDELAGWLGSMDQYRPRGGADVPKWIEFHGARPSTIDRQAGGTLPIKRACVSIAGTIQPQVLARALTPGYRESGLAARILLAMPPKRAKHWTEAEVSSETTMQYAELLRVLRNLPVDEDAHGDLKPVVLHLSADAKGAWIKYYNRWGAVQADADGDLAAVFSKIEGYAARFALVHHVVTCASSSLDDRVPISIKSIQAGIAQADWFAFEAERVYALLAESAEEREVRSLVDLIKRKGGSISARDLQRSNGKRYPTVESAIIALRLLVESGLGKISTITPATGGQPIPSSR